MIFLYLQAKLQLLKIVKLCCSAQAIENFFGSFSTWKKLAFSLLQFYDAAKVLQNQEQMRLNIDKKLKTASLDSRLKIYQF